MQSSFQQKSPFSVNKHSVSKVEPIPSQSHSDYGSNQESPIKKVSFLRSELSDNHEAEG